MLDTSGFRLIAVVGFVLAGTAVGTAAFGAAQSAPEPARAELAQDGADLVLRVQTSGRLELSRGGRVCLRISTKVRKLEEICVKRRGEKGRADSDLRRFSTGGTVVSTRRLRSEVKLRRQTLALRFLAADAGIAPGKLRWQLVLVAPRTDCEANSDCQTEVPERGVRTTAIRKLAGCIATGPSSRRGGPNVRRVALTFDDGPSIYTQSFLNTLRRFDVRATFFVLGIQVTGRGRLLQEMLRQGHELGNHSTAHRQYPSAGDIAETNKTVVATTGYRPCVFRPPYGLVNGTVVAGVRSLGMLTVRWNDDPSDFQSPGAGSIAASALAQARPGSIVLMHDGGGNRSQTLAALPAIIKGLRARGYELVTVQELLGLKYRYG